MDGFFPKDPGPPLIDFASSNNYGGLVQIGVVSGGQWGLCDSCPMDALDGYVWKRGASLPTVGRSEHELCKVAQALRHIPLAGSFKFPCYTIPASSNCAEFLPFHA